MVIGDIIKRNGKRYPEKEALVFGESRYTFKQLNDRVNSVANGLITLGVNKGDRVVVLMNNCLQFVELYCAVPKCGSVLVPLNPRLSDQDLTYLINDAEANTLIFGNDYSTLVNLIRPNLKTVKHFIIDGDSVEDWISYNELLSHSPADEPGLEVSEEDLVYLLYTSGTTGLPKGVMHTHKSIIACMLNYMIMSNIKSTDVTLATVPLFWIPAAVLFILPHFYMGAGIVLLKEFNPEIVLELIEKEGVTNTFLSPAQITSLLDSPDLSEHKTDSLRCVWFGGAALSPEVLRRAVNAFGNIFSNAYGLAEITPVSILPAKDMVLEGNPQELKRLASCGREAINVEARIVDDYGKDVAPGELGEVIAKGDNIMKGYWKLPQVTAEVLRGGYLYTGDLATIDEKGYIYLIGRKKDVITSGGKAIYPSEIEEVIYRCTSVSEVAVFGVPDDRLGEVIIAAVVAEGAEASITGEVIKLCQQNLPGYAVPSYVVVLDSMPRSPTGKVLRRLLREKYVPLA